jgi:hypothetical protein
MKGMRTRDPASERGAEKQKKTKKRAQQRDERVSTTTATRALTPVEARPVGATRARRPSGDNFSE